MLVRQREKFLKFLNLLAFIWNLNNLDLQSTLGAVNFQKWELFLAHLPGGGGVHNMFRVRVCAAHMGGFWAPNSLNKGPFFGRFSISKGGLSRNSEK